MVLAKKRESRERASESNSIYSDVDEDVVEEIVEKVNESVILLRFPCFDFFRNTHICESSMYKSSISSSPKTSSEVAGDTSSTPTEYVFDPTLVQVDPASSLDAPHPILILNKGTDNEMKFVGSWLESEYSMRGTHGSGVNRAVILLRQHCGSKEEMSVKKLPRLETIQNPSEVPSSLSLSEERKNQEKVSGPFLRSSPLAVEGNADGPIGSSSDAFTSSLRNELEDSKRESTFPSPTSPRAAVEVASIFSHDPVGITADEVRENRAKVLHTVYTKSIYVPSAVLVLHPLP